MLLNTQKTFYTPPNTFRIGLETSFSYPETFFKGRERLLTARDRFGISLDRSFTDPDLFFTYRDRMYNVSEYIINPIGVVDNLSGLLMNMSG